MTPSTEAGRALVEDANRTPADRPAQDLIAERLCDAAILTCRNEPGHPGEHWHPDHAPVPTVPGDTGGEPGSTFTDRRTGGTHLAAPAAPEVRGLDADLSCLGCGQVREPSTWDAQSHAYLCADCVWAMRSRVSLERIVMVIEEMDDMFRARRWWPYHDQEGLMATEPLAKALDPFRYDPHMEASRRARLREQP